MTIWAGVTAEPKELTILLFSVEAEIFKLNKLLSKPTLIKQHQRLNSRTCIDCLRMNTQREHYFSISKDKSNQSCTAVKSKIFLYDNMKKSFHRRANEYSCKFLLFTKKQILILYKKPKKRNLDTNGSC